MRTAFRRKPDCDAPTTRVKNYITPSGLQRLKDEHRFLLIGERLAMTLVVAWAASNGDRSENADYQYRKRRLRQIDRRIRFLTKRLDAAGVIDPETPRPGRAATRVYFRATVRYANAAGRERVASVVGTDEVALRAHSRGDVPRAARGRGLSARHGEALSRQSGWRADCTPSDIRPRTDEIPAAMKPRTLLFWAHLAIGAATLSFIFIMSATGVLLTYQRQILEWYDTHDYRAAPPSRDTPRLRPDQIVAAVRAERPDAAISSITFHVDPNAPAEAGIGRRTLYVNPYSGHVLGESTDGPRPLFRLLSSWHTGLGSGREGVGHTIAAASNLAVVFMVATGLVLWLPRQRSWGALRSSLWFRRGLSGRARNFNWHQVLGFWCSLPLLVIVVGALPMSYAWASDLVFRAVGESPEPRRGTVQAPAPGDDRGQLPTAGGRGPRGSPAGRGGGPDRGRGRSGPAVDMDRVTALWARAEQQGAGWQTITARLPAAADAPLEFTIEQGTSQQPQKRSVLSFDMRSDEAVSLVTFSNRSLGARIRTYLRFAHTGEVLGFPSQTLVAIASTSACVIAWTGLALTWRRLFGGRAPSASLSRASRSRGPHLA